MNPNRLSPKPGKALLFSSGAGQPTQNIPPVQPTVVEQPKLEPPVVQVLPIAQLTAAYEKVHMIPGPARRQPPEPSDRSGISIPTKGRSGNGALEQVWRLTANDPVVPISATVPTQRVSLVLQEILKAARNQGTTFRDPQFPASLSALVPRVERQKGLYPPQWRHYLWARAKDIFGSSKGKVCASVRPESILLGELDSTPLLESLACVAQYPMLIERLFDQTEMNPEGVYCLWLMWSGVWTQIILDDYLPIIDYQKGISIAFARSQEDDLWVNLVEKAFAKLTGSYSAITRIPALTALRSLTGAPLQIFELKPGNPSSLDELKEALAEAHSKGFLVAGVPAIQQNSGLITIQLVQTHDSQISLVIGGKTYSTDEARQHFSKLCVCRVHGEYYSNWLEDVDSAAPRSNSSQNRRSLFNLRVERGGHFYITIDQQTSEPTGLRLTLCSLGVGTRLDNDLAWVDCVYSPAATHIYSSNLLQKGEYICIVEYSAEAADPPVTLGTYGVGLSAISKIEIPAREVDELERRIWRSLMYRWQKPLKFKEDQQPEYRVELADGIGKTVIKRTKADWLRLFGIFVVGFEVEKGKRAGVELVLDSKQFHHVQTVADEIDCNSTWIRISPELPNVMLLKLRTSEPYHDFELEFRCKSARLIPWLQAEESNRLACILSCDQVPIPECTVPPEVNPLILQRLLELEQHSRPNKRLADVSSPRSSNSNIKERQRVDRKFQETDQIDKKFFPQSKVY